MRSAMSLKRSGGTKRTHSGAEGSPNLPISRGKCRGVQGGRRSRPTRSEAKPSEGSAKLGRSEQLCDRRARPVARAHLCGVTFPLGRENLEHLGHAGLESIIHHGVVETRALLELVPGDLEARRDRTRIVAAAQLATLATRREGRRQEEDEARVRAPRAHLARALHLD